MIFTKNLYGQKLDMCMESLEERRRRFYGDDVSDDSYVIVLTSLPGGFSSSFFEVKDKTDMYRVIYDIIDEVRGNSDKNLNKKCSYVERLYCPNDKTTTCLFLHDYEDFPKINYGTGSQFKYSRKNGILDSIHSVSYVS